jgi:outer membrane protein assembly factor BamB
MKKTLASSTILFIMAFAFTSTSVFALYPTTEPWPMYRYDPARTGTTPSTAPNTNTTLWISEVTYSYPTLHSPTIVDGKVIVVDGYTIEALDETTGVQLWASISFPTQLQSGPAYADGKIYVGSYGGFLYCVNASNGAKLWEYEATTSGYIQTSPAVADGVVYFGTTDPYLYALNASTGMYKWRYTGAGDAIYSSPTVSGDLLFFGCDDYRIYALNITGTLPSLKWYYETGNQVRGTVAVEGDRVFIGTYSTDHAVIALNKNDGSLIWTYTLANSWSIENSVAVADGVVYVIPYVASANNKIAALYANAPAGSYDETDPTIRKWSKTIGWGYYGSEPVVADGKVFFAHYQDNVYRVSALDVDDSTTVWSYEFPSGTTGSPVVADGRLFMVRNKYVYCFGSPYPPLTYHYPVSAGGEDFIVTLVINATPGELDTSSLITLKKISYTLEGIDGTLGMSNITIPNQMLGGPYVVAVDGGMPQYSAPPVDNGTHTSLYFTYLQSSHTVEITGTTVIPEFPSATVLPLLFAISLIVVAIAKKQLPKK